MKFQNKQMHNHFCFLSLLLDISNYFILHFFLEGATSGPVKEKNNKQREVKKDPEILGLS